MSKTGGLSKIKRIKVDLPVVCWTEMHYDIRAQMQCQTKMKVWKNYHKRKDMFRFVFPKGEVQVEGREREINQRK